MIDSLEAMRLISRYRPGDAIVISAMTANAEWAHVSTNPDLDLPQHGCMGKASSFGLGLALARPDLKVIVLDGDGSLLINLGSLVTVANMAPPNLVHFVLENGVYRNTGGQPIPGANKLSFTAMAAAAGYVKTYEFDEAPALEEKLASILSEVGPIMVCLKLPAATERTPHPMNSTRAAIGRFKAGLERTLATVQSPSGRSNTV